MPKLVEDTSADVVIVGGGIIGASCAYSLSQDGLRVVVLERDGLASGASGACQGGVGFGLTTAGYDLRLRLAAIAAYEELTWDDKNGVFDSVKVCTLPDSTLLREFDPDVLGFEYRISIMDVSGYPLEHRYSYQVGSGQVPVSGDVFTTVRPAVIRHSGGEYHAAHLVVSIWK